MSVHALGPVSNGFPAEGVSRKLRRCCSQILDLLHFVSCIFPGVPKWHRLSLLNRSNQPLTAFHAFSSLVNLNSSFPSQVDWQFSRCTTVRHLYLHARALFTPALSIHPARSTQHLTPCLDVASFRKSSMAMGFCSVLPSNPTDTWFRW